MGGAQDVEHLVEARPVDDIAYADEIEVICRNADNQVLLCDDPQYEVLPVLSLDRPHLDVLDDCGPVIGIDNRFADGESHVFSSPS